MAKTRYDAVAIGLHWLIALAILGNLGLGLYMVDLPLADPAKFDLYQIHKSLGVTVFALSAARLGWRLAHPPPAPLPAPRAERLAAQAAHWAFYALMIGLPVTGWLMVSASPWNVPTFVWGGIELPHLPALAELAPDAKPAAEALWKQVHWGGVLAFGALLALHVGAALRHHFILRDRTLARMTPFLRIDQAGSRGEGR